MKIKYKKLIPLILSSTLLLSNLTGCSQEQKTVEINKNTIITTNYVLYDFAKQIIGDDKNINLELLIIEENNPSSRDINKINKAGLVLFMENDYDTWILDNIDSGKITNVNIQNLKSEEIKTIEINNINNKADINDYIIIGTEDSQSSTEKNDNITIINPNMSSSENNEQENNNQNSSGNDSNNDSSSNGNNHNNNDSNNENNSNDNNSNNGNNSNNNNSNNGNNSNTNSSENSDDYVDDSLKDPDGYWDMEEDPEGYWDNELEDPDGYWDMEEDPEGYWDNELEDPEGYWDFEGYVPTSFFNTSKKIPLVTTQRYYDNNYWMDIKNGIIILENTYDALINWKPENKETYKMNKDKYKSLLESLDKKYKETVDSSLNSLIFIGGSFEYSYLIEGYELRYMSLYDYNNQESTPKTSRIQNMQNIINKYNIKYIIKDKTSTNDGIEQLKTEVRHNLNIVIIDTLRTTTPEDNTSYYEVMTNNLKVLKKAIY